MKSSFRLSSTSEDIFFLLILSKIFVLQSLAKGVHKARVPLGGELHTTSLMLGQVFLFRKIK